MKRYALPLPILLLLVPWLVAGCGSSDSPDNAGSLDASTASDASTGGDAASTGDSAAVDSGWNQDADPPFEPPKCDPPDPAKGFHITLDGTKDGDGSLAHPWDIATGLKTPPNVNPGDTIWVHKGQYKGTFVIKQDGAEGAPVTIRAWPGDRVTLDSNGAKDAPVVSVWHKWIVLRDLELTNSNPDRRNARTTGIYLGADHVSLVNMTIHDVGVGVSGGQLTNDGHQEGTDILIYGTLFYNNGWKGDDRGHGHNTYLTNRDSVIRLKDNIIFYAYGTGIHNYSAGDRNFVYNNEIIGNVWFLNGAPGGKLVDGCLVGHDGTNVVKHVLLRENYGWALNLNGRDVRLGWDTPNEDAQMYDNYLVGKTIFQRQWTGVKIKGNTFIGSLEGEDPKDYPDNTYLQAPPKTNHIVIRPNAYEPGRAHVIVYNWEKSDSVPIDISAVVPKGTNYELRNAQDYYGKPVLQGVYDGGKLDVPMAGLEPVQPIGDPKAITDANKTGRNFNVFVLRSAVCE